MTSSSETSNSGSGKYIVGYLDILGFKNLVDKEELETVKEKMQGYREELGL